MTEVIKERPAWYRLSGALHDRIEAGFKVIVDAKDHDLWQLERELEAGGGYLTFQFLLNSDDVEGIEIPEEVVNEVLLAWDTNMPIKPALPLRKTYTYRCDYCGELPLFTDGFKIFPAEHCDLKNEYSAIKVEIPVPSGRLIVGNDFRPEFDVQEDFNVNSKLGIKLTVEAMAKNGCLHPFVGNTSPDLIRTGEDEFILVTNFYEDEDGNEAEADLGETVASVCTDLWWASIVDGAEADCRGLEYRTGNWTDNEDVLVTPGTYVMEYYGVAPTFDRDDYSKPTIYAKIYRKADS